MSYIDKYDKKILAMMREGLSCDFQESDNLMGSGLVLDKAIYQNTLDKKSNDLTVAWGIVNGINHGRIICFIYLNEKK